MADKTRTIKDATDKELDALIIRLRKESELQNLISNLNRKSSSYCDEYENRLPISTEVPIENLYHHGILGMRWGIRRNPGPDGRVSTKDSGSSEYKRARELAKKGARNLSNDEIKELTNRFNLESQYKTLNPTAMKRGMNLVKGAIAVGTTAVTIHSLVTSPLGKSVIKAVQTGLKKGV